MNGEEFSYIIENFRHTKISFIVNVVMTGLALGIILGGIKYDPSLLLPKRCCGLEFLVWVGLIQGSAFSPLFPLGQLDDNYKELLSSVYVVWDDVILVS